MIARFAGRCSICKQTISQGTDCWYDADKKTITHWECLSTQPPDAQAIALADELDFCRHDDASIRAAAPRWQVRAHWALRHLLDALRSDSAGRPPSEAPAQSQPSLFDEKGVK